MTCQRMKTTVRGREGKAVMTHQITEQGLRPRLLLAYADSAFAAAAVRRFRRLGWEAHLVASAEEVQRLVETYAPEVLVLDVELPDESGWLTSAKVALSHPRQRIVLLTAERADAQRERAAQVGAAAIVARSDGVPALVQAVYGRGRARAV